MSQAEFEEDLGPVQVNIEDFEDELWDSFKRTVSDDVIPSKAVTAEVPKRAKKKRKGRRRKNYATKNKGQDRLTKSKKSYHRRKNKDRTGSAGPNWRGGKGCQSCNPKWYFIISELKILGNSIRDIANTIKQRFPGENTPKVSAVRAHLKHAEEMPISNTELVLAKKMRADMRASDITIDAMVEMAETLKRIKDTIVVIEVQEEETGNIIGQKRQWIKLYMDAIGIFETLQSKYIDNDGSRKGMIVSDMNKIFRTLEKKVGNKQLFHLVAVELIRMLEGDENAAIVMGYIKSDSEMER